MSGIFIDGVFHENTDLICRRCKAPAWPSDNPEYSYQCLVCDEDLYEFETEEQDPHYQPKVMIARPINDIPLNTAIEYILDDDTGEARVFVNQIEAEMFLIGHGIDPEDADIYFVEFEHEPK